MKAYHNLYWPTTADDHTVISSRPVLSRLRQHAPAIMVLIGLVCLSYPGWFSAGAYAFDDLTRLNAPQRMFVGYMLLHGQLPLWNPYNFGGQPFLAAGQSGPLYLPNLIYALLPITTALKVSYAFHAVVAALSVYMIVYKLTGKRVASVAGGIVFATNGFMLGHQIHTQMYDAISLVPLALYFLLQLLDNPAWRYTIGLSIAAALEIYAGHPQVTFYLLIVLFVCAVTIIGLTLWNGVARRFLRLATSAFLTLLLSAPQWLPTLRLVPYSDRAHASKAFLLGGSLPKAGLLQFLSPFTAGGGYTGIPLAENFLHLYGTSLFWEFTCYTGLAALLLAVTALLTGLRVHPVVPALGLQGILGVLLALGTNGPLKWALSHLPGFDMFRIPARYAVLTEISIAILAGVGIALLMDAVEWRRRVPMVVLTLAGLSAASVLFLAHLTGALVQSPWMAVIVPSGMAISLLVLSWLLWFGQPSRPTVTSTVLAAIVCLDVVVPAAGWSGFVIKSSPAYASHNKAASFISSQLKRTDPMQKVAAMPATSLAFDKSLAFRIPTINGYDSLEPAWYVEHLNLTWSAVDLFSQPRSMMDALGVKFLLTPAKIDAYWATDASGVTRVVHWLKVPKAASALEVKVGTVNTPSVPIYGPLMSVTLLCGQDHLTELLTGFPNQHFLIPIPPSWPRQQSTEIILRNETWQEQVQISSVSWLTNQVHGPTFLSNVWVNPEAWKRVYSDGKEAVWENTTNPSGAYVTINPEDPVTGLSGTAQVKSFQANKEVWSVRSTTSSELVLSQTYDPGWRATVDGTPVAVLQVGALYGGLLTGVPVPAGRHTVRLTYHPLGFRTGVLMFLTGLLGILVVSALKMHKRQKRQEKRSE